MVDSLVQDIAKSWAVWLFGPPAFVFAAALVRSRIIARRQLFESIRSNLAKVPTLVDDVSGIKKQLEANGGTTFRDVVERISHMSAAQLALTDVFDQAIMFADGRGECTHVNHAFEEMVGYSRETMLGRGWIGALEDSCRMRVVESWRRAVKDRRIFNAVATFQHREGFLIQAVITANTIDGKPGEVTGWMAVVRCERGTQLAQQQQRREA